jgi:hypothetical protein
MGNNIASESEEPQSELPIQRSFTSVNTEAVKTPRTKTGIIMPSLSIAPTTPRGAPITPRGAPTTPRGAPITPRGTPSSMRVATRPPTIQEYDQEIMNKEYLAAVDRLTYSTNSSTDFVKALNELGNLFEKYPTVVTHTESGWGRVDGIEERFAAENHINIIAEKYAKYAQAERPNINVPKTLIQVITKMLKSGILTQNVLQSTILQFTLVSLYQFPNDEQLLLDSASLITNQLAIGITKLEQEKASRFTSIVLKGVRKFPSNDKLVKDSLLFIKNYCKSFDIHDEIENITDALIEIIRISTGDVSKVIMEILENITNKKKNLEQLERCVAVADELVSQKSDTSEDIYVTIMRWKCKKAIPAEKIAKMIIADDKLSYIDKFITESDTDGEEKFMIALLEVLHVISKDEMSWKKLLQHGKKLPQVITKIEELINKEQFKTQEIQELIKFLRVFFNQ